MGRSIYCFSYVDGGCELSVQKKKLHFTYCKTVVYSEQILALPDFRQLSLKYATIKGSSQ